MKLNSKNKNKIEETKETQRRRVPISLSTAKI
jgi:hypothetical protein